MQASVTLLVLLVVMMSADCSIIHKRTSIYFPFENSHQCLHNSYHCVDFLDVDKNHVPVGATQEVIMQLHCQRITNAANCFIPKVRENCQETGQNIIDFINDWVANACGQAINSDDA